jgi:hypothetical protein
VPADLRKAWISRRGWRAEMPTRTCLRWHPPRRHARMIAGREVAQLDALAWKSSTALPMANVHCPRRRTPVAYEGDLRRTTAMSWNGWELGRPGAGDMGARGQQPCAERSCSNATARRQGRAAEAAGTDRLGVAGDAARHHRRRHAGMLGRRQRQQPRRDPGLARSVETRSLQRRRSAFPAPSTTGRSTKRWMPRSGRGEAVEITTAGPHDGATSSAEPPATASISRPLPPRNPLHLTRRSPLTRTGAGGP